MIRSYKRLLLLFLIPLVLAAQQTGVKPNAVAPQLNGIWELSLDSSQTSLTFDSQLSGRKIVMFKSIGPDVQVSDPETRMISAGKAYDSTKFSFSFPVKTESAGNARPAVFNGSVSGSTIVGTTKVNGVDVEWKAVKLLSAWECANHKNPSHIATSEDEMRSLTKQYMCAGWHKLK